MTTDSPLPLPSFASDKEKELRRIKRHALALLSAAVILFVAMALAPVNTWTGVFKAIAEAAMVGGLADWFAVVALFRRIPVPFISTHTDIIAQNKDRIADNLALFVEEKFLDVPSLIGLIRKHDPAQKVTIWLNDPGNHVLLGKYLSRFLGGILDVTDDVRIQAFIREAIHAVIDKIDLSHSLGSVLDTMTRDGRHQELLDDGIVWLTGLIKQPGTREFIAERIIFWLKHDHPKKEKMLPSAWLGDNGAEIVATAINRMLLQIGDDRDHQLRTRFDQLVQGFIGRLKTDPAFQQKGEELRRYLKEGEALQGYIKDMWQDLRGWLKQDLAAEDGNSAIFEKIAMSGKWLGLELAGNPALRTALNDHMEQAARAMAPELTSYLTRHISDTIKNWDARELSRHIELNIGRDLQFIRINGTLVGGTLGLILYLCSMLIEHIRTLL